MKFVRNQPKISTVAKNDVLVCTMSINMFCVNSHLKYHFLDNIWGKTLLFS